MNDESRVEETDEQGQKKGNEKKSEMNSVSKLQCPNLGGFGNT
jgi:hypothetical protein